MKKAFTEFYRLRNLCSKIANEESGIVEAREMDQRVEDVAISAVKSLREAYDALFEFVLQPDIAPLFDKWLEERE